MNDTLTGFYDLSKLTKSKLKAFFKDAVMLSYTSYVHKLEGWQREECTDYSLEYMINLASNDTHNVCIDRSIQNDTSKYGEVGFSTFHRKPNVYLYCHLTLDNLKILTDKYNLIMK